MSNSATFLFHVSYSSVMAVRDVSILILYTAEGKILLQHRSKDAQRLPDYWAFFGGDIEAGETPKQALRRESLEELSYEVQNPHLLITQKFTYKEDENTKYVFVEKYENQPLQLGEGQGMEWFLPDETGELKIIDHDRSVIQQVQNYLSET